MDILKLDYKQISEHKALMIKDAEKFIDEIEAQVNPKTFRTCLYMFVKIWDKVYENIIVNKEQII